MYLWEFPRAKINYVCVHVCEKITLRPQTKKLVYVFKRIGVEIHKDS